MEIKDYLLEEFKRLNRQNDLLEKKINQDKAINNEPEQIVNNISAMCGIANIIFNLQQEKKTSAAGTTDVIQINGKKVSSFV